ncbi:MAG TPA: molybdopterin-dependent oxidoreductase [Steroidobacteraceae bacterium]|jgi:DMSO/TMAO reductase YedYZ molybdopterin-dependent catalytic subunit
MEMRRKILKAALGGASMMGSGLISRTAQAGLPQGALDSTVLETLPGKQPLLKRAYRPPNYESPVSYFDAPITPNERFFVRWHLMDVPEIDAEQWRLTVGGEGSSQSLSLTLDQLKRDFEPAEIVAVCQCAGNRRGLSDPHVPGVQWGPGAMGNARWKGARLKDVLARAGLKPEVIEIAFDGADRPPLEATPDFIKSIPTWKALDENTLIAYEMNGAALPHLNGFPARIVVPGWTATYWMKKVTRIETLNQPLKSFWMNTAYRIPKGKFTMVDRFLSQESETTTPITEMVVNSLITSIADGQRFARGAPIVVRGLAWDGGYGIRRVEISIDEGKTWLAATPGANLGRYSFLPWKFTYKPQKHGRMSIMARASNSLGSSQPDQLIFNGPGYHNNVIQKIAVEIV